MKLDNDTAILIARLEYLVGKECYNPNSYDGWNDIEGCDFRYPISVPDKKGEYTKVKDAITRSAFIDAEDITPDAMSYMKYKFGSNELYIGKGLINVLIFLESRYGIDFNKLEQKRIQKYGKEE